MDLLSALPKIVADVATALIKQRSENRVRQRLGELLLKVAECVVAIGEGIRDGVDTAERCAELDVYIQHLEDLVMRECSDDTARQLVFWLTHVAEAPGVGRLNITSILTRETKPKWLTWRRDEQAREVLQIAGYIRAIGNLVQA